MLPRKSPIGPSTASVEEAIRTLIDYLGDDKDREGLLETPKRVRLAMLEMFNGYGQNVEDVFKTFDAESYDEMVLVKNVEFFSTCEHHMLPFQGVAHVAYIPMYDNGGGWGKAKIIGLSKLARLVDIFARRLQVQERLTHQIVDALELHLKPLGSACIIEASHMCMACRGVRKQQASMVTSCIRGAFNEGPARAELFSLIRS